MGKCAASVASRRRLGAMGGSHRERERERACEKKARPVGMGIGGRAGEEAKVRQMVMTFSIRREVSAESKV